MANAHPFRRHLRFARDLETPYEATRAGFVSLALEKNRRATPIVQEARALYALASAAKRPIDLLEMNEIQTALLTASGLSDKAVGHLDETNKREAVMLLIRNYLEPAGIKFVEELVYRFLITRGDSLGGSMRNIGGALAQYKVISSILAYFRISGVTAYWQNSQSGAWSVHSSDQVGIETDLKAIGWSTNGVDRLLLFNIRVPLVRNNVDIVLIHANYEKVDAAILLDPGCYMALGELKGGIDPAGADEHWKTARTALTRIHDAFKKSHSSPVLFFMGAAIERKMSAEIWHMLLKGQLSNAANITDDKQMISLTQWLCSL